MIFWHNAMQCISPNKRFISSREDSRADLRKALCETSLYIGTVLCGPFCLCSLSMKQLSLHKGQLQKNVFRRSHCITLKKALQALTLFILHSFCLTSILYLHEQPPPYTKYNNQDTFYSVICTEVNVLMFLNF